MRNYIIFKLIGLAILTMITLVLVSIIEVAAYSYIINPGHVESFYERHANYSAPYISGIFGFVIFYFITRYWKKREYPNVLYLSILFPLSYVLLDIILITTAGVIWADYILIFAIANTAKIIGSYLGFKLTIKK